ncbi:MAG: 4-vinyl reductase [Candidatus Sericytochromatia bacterium]|nr:4-vinyl reductase [Candidatus Sericytochromatia bacterium]
MANYSNLGPTISNHNYYNLEDYYKNTKEGKIFDKYQKRVVLADENFIVGLQKGLEEEVGDVAQMIMYKCGYSWALEDMKNFDKRFKSEFDGRAIDEMNFNMVLQTWWWPLSITGWGSWDFDFSYKKQGLIFVNLYDSAVAKSLGNIGKVACHFYAGLFAGVFTYLSKKELEGIEIQCYSMGETFCKFMIGMDKKVNAADFWVKEGATAKEIIDKMI